jgi:hypothetical protein
MQLSEVKDKVDAAAAVIAILPADERAGWVLYLLEVLDRTCKEKDITTLLVDVSLAVDARIQEGGW